MSRFVTVVCFLIALIAVPVWFLLAGVAPGMFGSGVQTAPLAQKLGPYGALALIWGIPVWMLFFGWRAIKGWRTRTSGGPAILMALPALALIGMVALVMLAQFAP